MRVKRKEWELIKINRVQNCCRWVEQQNNNSRSLRFPEYPTLRRSGFRTAHYNDHRCEYYQLSQWSQRWKLMTWQALLWEPSNITFPSSLQIYWNWINLVFYFCSHGAVQYKQNSAQQWRQTCEGVAAVRNSNVFHPSQRALVITSRAGWRRRGGRNFIPQMWHWLKVKNIWGKLWKKFLSEMKGGKKGKL